MIGGLKVSASLTSFFIISIGMILTNTVVVLFWHASVLTTAMENAGHQLSLLTHIYSKGNDFDDRIRFNDAMSTTMVHLEAKCVRIVAEQKIVVGQEEHCLAGLKMVMDDVKSSSTPVHYFSHSPLVSLFVPSSYAYVAVPFQSSLQGNAAIGLGIPLFVYWFDLLRQEKVIAGFLLVQAFVLAVLAFFRLSQSVFRPVDRLIRLADTYQVKNSFHFIGDTSVGELGQLSSAVRSMLQRIDYDRRALEHTIEQLELANRDIEQSRQEMVSAEKMAVTGRLAAGLAHEIGNPLGIVSGYLELLKKGDVTWLDKLDYIQRSEGELARVHQLVRQLVDCSRKPILQLEQFSAFPLVASVVEMLQHDKHSRSVRFTLVNRAVDDVVLAQPDALKQVLLNCILNSIDAIKDMGSDHEGLIQMSIANVDDEQVPYLLIVVNDNGCGIFIEQQSSVFDPFFTTKPPGVGTGLGLTVSQSLVEGFQGKIHFKSAEGCGSKMRIYVPLGSAGSCSCTIRENDSMIGEYGR